MSIGIRHWMKHTMAQMLPGLHSNFKDLSKIYQCGTGKNSPSLTMPISDIRPLHMKPKTTAQMSLATFCAVSNPTL